MYVYQQFTHGRWKNGGRERIFAPVCLLMQSMEFLKKVDIQSHFLLLFFFYSIIYILDSSFFKLIVLDTAFSVQHAYVASVFVYLRIVA